MSELIYLGIPYTDPDETVKMDRYDKVNRIAATLMAQGYMIYSPISHCVPICDSSLLLNDKPKEFWWAHDVSILRYCQKLLVLTLPGWKDSEGLANEIRVANELAISIIYIDYQTILDYGGAYYEI